jgi:hypothetical protein
MSIRLGCEVYAWEGFTILRSIVTMLLKCWKKVENSILMKELSTCPKNTHFCNTLYLLSIGFEN